jgi:hypothetical protein
VNGSGRMMPCGLRALPCQSLAVVLCKQY